MAVLQPDDLNSYIFDLGEEYLPNGRNYIENSLYNSGLNRETFHDPSKQFYLGSTSQLFKMWDGSSFQQLSTQVAPLTNTRIPFVDNNGQLTDNANLTFSGQTETVTQLAIGTGKISSYNTIATKGYGVPAIVDMLTLTGQAGDIITTNFTNAGVAGLYRINYSLEDTTADLTAGSITLTLAWTDDAGSTTSTANQILTALGRTSGVIFVQLTSGSITYTVSHSGILASAIYALYCIVERLN